jgi:hypothetical protein
VNNWRGLSLPLLSKFTFKDVTQILTKNPNENASIFQGTAQLEHPITDLSPGYFRLDLNLCIPCWIGQFSSLEKK